MHVFNDIDHQVISLSLDMTTQVVAVVISPRGTWMLTHYIVIIKINKCYSRPNNHRSH